MCMFDVLLYEITVNVGTHSIVVIDIPWFIVMMLVIIKCEKSLINKLCWGLFSQRKWARNLPIAHLQQNNFSNAQLLNKLHLIVEFAEILRTLLYSLLLGNMLMFDYFQFFASQYLNIIYNLSDNHYINVIRCRCSLYQGLLGIEFQAQIQHLLDGIWS